MTTATNKFLPFERPLQDAGRMAAAMDFDARTYCVIEDWARQHGGRFASVMDQIAEVLAGEITAASYPTVGAARRLRILDLDRLIDRLIDRSIRPPRVACEEPYPSASSPATTSRAAAVKLSQLVHEDDNQDAEARRRREILEYYSDLTGNRITAADHAKLKLVFDLPDRVIQAGILHALNYATRPIGSFAYCVRAMDNFLDPGMDLEAMIDQLIDKLLRKRATGQLILPLAGEKLLIGDFGNHDNNSDQ